MASTWTSTWFPTDRFKFTSRRTSCPCMQVYPTKSRRAAWWTLWRTLGLASQMKPSRRYRAMTATASPSSRRGTGGDRSGPTLTGSSCEAWSATATRDRPSACEKPSSPCARSKASTSTTTPLPVSGTARTSSRGRRLCSWTCSWTKGGSTLRLQNKVAVITGASLGIGSAIALAFAKEGAAVALDYRSHPGEAKEIVDRVEGSGGRAISVHADVSSAEDVKNLIQTAVRAFGRLDVMVNNAGM